MTGQSVGGGASEEPAEGGDEEMSESVKQLQEQVNRLTRERDQRKASDHARSLLESAGREATDSRIKILCALESDTERKAAINDWPQKSQGRTRPERSEPLYESTDYKPAASGKELAERMRAAR